MPIVIWRLRFFVRYKTNTFEHLKTRICNFRQK